MSGERHQMRRILGLSVLSLSIWCVAGCDSTLFTPNAEFAACQTAQWPVDAVVETEAGTFWYGDQTVIPHGINSYPILQHMGNGELDHIRNIFIQATQLGRPLLRTNAFMDGGQNPARIRDHDGTIREEGLQALDRVVFEAQTAGVRLLFVLTNNWEDYGGAQAVIDAVAPGEGLPKDAFWSDPRAVANHQHYIETILTRTNSLTNRQYAQDPTILGWELANEPRCDDTAWCDDQTLVQWAETMSATLRGAGAGQPIFWGGEGHLGESEAQVELVGRSGAVDVLTLHLYLHYSHPELAQFHEPQRIESAIQIGASIIRERAQLARQLGLPLVIEELGWKPPANSLDRDDERAAIYRGWLATAHEEQLATWPWMIGESGREDYDGLLIRPTDRATWETISCAPTQ